MAEPLRLGIAGLGTVGAAVIGLIDRHQAQIAEATGRAVKVVAVSARDRLKDRGVGLDRFAWFDDPVALAADPSIDVFVELMGGAEGSARAAVEAALGAGKSVVTANKALLATHGLDLAAKAEAKGVALNFEAAVAGGIPVIKTLREALLANRVERVFGILNGTCNYILTRMGNEGVDFATVLRDAQRLGYAEADPSFDVDGFDTAHKLALLAGLAFGTRIDAAAVHVEGIRSITPEDLQAADELGYRIKLLGVAARTASGIEQRVHPTMVPKSAAIAQVSGVTNAVAIDADALSLTLVGPGAGGDATASAVVADIADLARGARTAPFLVPVARLAEPGTPAIATHAGGYYIRLAVHDRPGAFAAIAGRMAEEKISLESIVQRHRGATLGGEDPAAAAKPAPVILVTYATTETAVRRALAAIEADGVVAEKPQLIRIEKS